MRRILQLLLLSALLTSIFGGYGVTVESSQPRAQGGGESQLIDIKADLVYPHKINDTLSVLCMVGSFAAQHNGAVITADSAVRYDDERLECFGRVLINKNTTYAYADRAEYDGESNVAQLFAPLVKVVDQDITMYAYNFSFNTLNNVGYYWDGGVTTKAAESAEEEESVMESKRGYYYADAKRVVGVESVELRGDGYQMKGDSVIYEMEGERAYFFEGTNIWGEDEEFIYGDLGLYDKAEDLYSVSRNGYLLTKEQEVWSDSMEYYRSREEAILRSNIQIDDTTNKVLAFGDYARYWGDIEKILLTRRPVVISYDTSQGDSIFLRGDSILLVSYLWAEGPVAERVAESNSAMNDAMAELLGLTNVEPEPEPEEAEEIEEEKPIEVAEEEEVVVEEAVVVEEQPKEPTKRELKTMAREQKQRDRLRAQDVRDYRKLVARREATLGRIERNIERGRSTFTDSMVLRRLEGEIASSRYVTDSLAKLDTLKADLNGVLDSLSLDSLAIDTLSKEDSLYRVVSIYRNALAYRNDFQISADSLVAISYDTTMQAYLSPVVWSASHQVSSDEMLLYTHEGNLDYAEFFGKPIMSSQVVPDDESYFNQVTGKEMTAYFEDNNITRNDVKGSVETIYYIQDDETEEVNTISKVTSGSASFFVEDRQLDGIVYRERPAYVFAPLDKMPIDVSPTLPDFVWYGSRRPTRESIFDGTIRPSQREQMRGIAKPLFPISDEIAAERKRLTRRGVWRDRTDVVSEEATLWMNSLGFTPGEPRAEGESPF